MTKDTRRSLPAVGSQAFNSQLREAVETYLGNQGDVLNRGVTLRDLQDAGLIEVSESYLKRRTGSPIGRVNAPLTGGGGGGGTVIINPGDEYEPDLTPPPTPTGFSVSAGISYVFAQCDSQVYTAGHGHAVSVLYGAKRASPAAPAPLFSDAVPLSTFPGVVEAYPTDPNTIWHLWLKWVTKDGVESAAPAGGTNGLVAVTGQNVQSLLDALTAAAQNPNAPYSRIAWRANLFYVSSETGNDPVFSVVTSPIVVNGVTVPVGTYMKAAFIMDGTITNAKIGNLAVDDAKISSLNVSKLQAGSLAVGSFIQSTNYVANSAGFRINANGSVEFNNAIIRGGAFIGNGTVGGIQIAPTYIQSSNYDGNGNGFRLDANGTLSLPNGSVNAAQLNVGAGANLLYDSQWVMRTGQFNATPIGWDLFANEIGTADFHNQDDFPDWFPPTVKGVVAQNFGVGAHGAGYYMIAQGRFPAMPGRRYECHILSGAHRCRVYAYFVWFDGYNNEIGYSQDFLILNDEQAPGGRYLSSFKKVGCFGTAPSTAAWGLLRVIKDPTKSGDSSYAFLCQPFVGFARANQTAFSDYSPSGIGTIITPMGISTPSLQAISGVMGNLYAGSVRGGSFAGGYDWPYDGGGGYYLGPEGLLLGNGRSTNQYFQVEANGNLHTPGFTVIGGRMNVFQVDVMGGLQIRSGEVATTTWGRGQGSAFVDIGVPAGTNATVMLVASWQGGPVNPGVSSTYNLINVPGQTVVSGSYIAYYTGGGDVGITPVYAGWQPPVTMTSIIGLGGGTTHRLTCSAQYGWDCTLTATVTRGH